MAKFYGPIGFAEMVEKSPGVYKPIITERGYYCEVVRFDSSWTSSSDSTNDDLIIDNQFSILADPFASQKFHTMKYIEFMGVKWKITKVKPGYPRMILTTGGVYNG